VRLFAYLVLVVLWAVVLIGAGMDPIAGILIALVAAAFCSFGDLILVAIISWLE
jgi:p-aminobenzoyl-glutamate transporter AbgT